MELQLDMLFQAPTLQRPKLMTGEHEVLNGGVDQQLTLSLAKLRKIGFIVDGFESDASLKKIKLSDPQIAVQDGLARRLIALRVQLVRHRLQTLCLHMFAYPGAFMRLLGTDADKKAELQRMKELHAAWQTMVKSPVTTYTKMVNKSCLREPLVKTLGKNRCPRHSFTSPTCYFPILPVYINRIPLHFWLDWSQIRILPF